MTIVPTELIAVDRDVLFELINRKYKLILRADPKAFKEVIENAEAEEIQTAVFPGDEHDDDYLGNFVDAHIREFYYQLELALFPIRENPALITELKEYILEQNEKPFLYDFAEEPRSKIRLAYSRSEASEKPPEKTE